MTFLRVASMPDAARILHLLDPLLWAGTACGRFARQRGRTPARMLPPPRSAPLRHVLRDDGQNARSGFRLHADGDGSANLPLLSRLRDSCDVHASRLGVGPGEYARPSGAGDPDCFRPLGRFLPHHSVPRRARASRFSPELRIYPWNAHQVAMRGSGDPYSSRPGGQR